MYCSLVFFIFATVSSFVQCANVCWEREVNVTEVLNVDCTDEFKKERDTAMRNANCKPYYRHVVLEPMPGQVFNPPLVYVSRCDGRSEADIVCAPTRTRIKQVPVFVLTSGSNGLKQSNECTVVNVVEHVSCGNVCIEQATDCNAEQNYDRKRCKCVCKDRQARNHKCSKLEAIKKWDDEDCQCKCKETNTNCTTGYKWNLEQCICVKMMR